MASTYDMLLQVTTVHKIIERISRYYNKTALNFFIFRDALLRRPDTGYQRAIEYTRIDRELRKLHRQVEREIVAKYGQRTQVKAKELQKIKKEKEKERTMMSSM